MDENRKSKKRKTARRDERSRPQKQADSVGVARRSVWYILRTLLIFFAVVTLCYTVFMEAMYISNLYIVATEGMQARADCILMGGGVLDLSNYFDEYWLSADTDLYAGKYDSFHVDTYDYRIDIEKFAVYPWSTQAKLVVVERIPSISAEAFDASNEQPIPAWESLRYEISAEKIEGKWLITGLTVLERNPEPEPASTPDYSQLETGVPTR